MRDPDITIIDSDRHVIEPPDMWRRYMPKQYEDIAPFTDRTTGYTTFAGAVMPPAGTPTTNTAHGQRMGRYTAPEYEPMRERNFDAVSHLGAMDLEGIDLAVMFPTTGLYIPGVDGVDPILIAEACAAYNNWLSDFCSEGQGRLFGTGMLDLRDIERACREARRCVEDLGFVGVFMRPNVVEGLPLFDEKYEPLWATIEELGVPVCFHEGARVLVPQNGVHQLGYRWARWHVCTHAHEQQTAMVALILGRVLERHPKLNVGFLECGSGWLPYWMWRMDEHAEAKLWNYQLDEPEPLLELEPSDFVRRQCFVGLEGDETPAAETVSLLEGRNVMWASDFPHVDATFPGAVDKFFRLEGISDDHRRRILCQNPVDFYGSPLAAAVDGVRRQRPAMA